MAEVRRPSTAAVATTTAMSSSPTPVPAPAAATAAAAAAAGGGAARPQRFGPYHVGETIGRGTFAKVKIAVHESSKSRVALKIIPRKYMDANTHSATKIRREIGIMRVLRHPHITRLYDVVQTKHDIVLVLEYVSGGELFRYINRRGRLGEAQARTLFQQLAAAVAYCHRLRVTHRDIKPENILLEGHTLAVKLSDFGLSSITHDGRFFNTSCGTPNYASPEVVSGMLYGGPETDVWSCGVVLYAMLCGKLPFDEDDVGVLFRKIRTAEFVVPPYVSSEARDLLHRMLVVDSLRRATMEQVMQHPWLRPTYPRYLLSLHYAAVLESMRFARDRDTDTGSAATAAASSTSSSSSAATASSSSSLDLDVVEALAVRFRVTPAHVVACVRAEEQRTPSMFAVLSEGHPGAVRRYPAAVYFETHSSVLDSKLWPTPLEVALAEVALRDEAHDVYVSYCILASKKQSRRCVEDAYVDPSLNASANSFLLSQSAQGYGSLNAHSLYQVSGNNSFAAGVGRGDKAAAAAAAGGGGGGAMTPLTKARPMDEHLLAHLSTTSTTTATAAAGAADGSRSSSVSSTAATTTAAAAAVGGDDEWVRGYNRVVAAFLPLRCAASQHSVLGRRLGVDEMPVAVLLERRCTLRPRPRDVTAPRGRRCSSSSSSSDDDNNSSDDSSSSSGDSRSRSNDGGSNSSSHREGSRSDNDATDAAVTALECAARLSPSTSATAAAAAAAAAAGAAAAMTSSASLSTSSRSRPSASGSLLRPVCRSRRDSQLRPYASVYRGSHSGAGGVSNNNNNVINSSSGGSSSVSAAVYGAAPPLLSASRLLRPLSNRDVREREVATSTRATAAARARVGRRPGSTTEQQQQQQQQQQTSSSSSSPSATTTTAAPALLYETVDTMRFGNDYLRNGVAFVPCTPALTLSHLYAALREEGLLWRPIYNFCLACVRYPHVKLQVKMYKLAAQVQVVDVKVSVQSGMEACDAAVALLERLRRRAATLQQQPVHVQHRSPA